MSCPICDKQKPKTMYLTNALNIIPPEIKPSRNRSARTLKKMLARLPKTYMPVVLGLSQDTLDKFAELAKAPDSKLNIIKGRT